ncbi:fibronectin/fibrinogen-binding protein [Nautilia profundicola AmH]|uniref:Fibronectin/fibrinogen-binding protein n=1 Tax=Nautilia profundicola (strain ATCC BAA-1463 / DSM 18972 / AmH) TaxID=598659 RepID=B9L7P9_NAUPA|nr:NFACT RNA binding domain-containing protein [Nautilia profundicola]ACM92176.1 fibronectin/fibrinogen-binding protein [Nautilia profundicola AmH]
MKAFVLKKIARNLKNHKYIKRALRVDENLILMQFDKDRYYFDLTKGSGDIYINIDYPLSRKFQAPFDIVLEKKFTKAELVDVEAKERILTITAKNQNRYKEETVKIRFEFTGRYTNAIILDENDTIIESLRHISESQSSRVVKPGVKLEELPPFEIKEKEFEIEDLERYTKELFNKKYQNRLRQKKEAIINRINKKIKEIQKKLSKLDDEEKLLQKAELYKKYADIAMANLYQIKPYSKELKTYDFEGNEITIPLPELKNVNEVGNYFYNLAKKAKRKAENLHIEKGHLNSQLEFLENYKRLIEKTEDLGSLNYYKPPKKEKSVDENVAEFFIDDYKILVGKNEKGNIKLLKSANANDMWLHIKNYPGSHVIIKNNKLSIPQSVIEEAARLAVAFSKKNEGEVDYTKRKFVKVKEGANVEYGKYSTIKVKL